MVLNSTKEITIVLNAEYFVAIPCVTHKMNKKITKTEKKEERRHSFTSMGSQVYRYNVFNLSHSFFTCAAYFQ